MEEVNVKEMRIVLDSIKVENDFQNQNVIEIKEEVVSDDEPTDLQPISQVYLKDQIKSEKVDPSLAEQIEDEHEDKTQIYSCTLCNSTNMRFMDFKIHLTTMHHLSKEEILKYVSAFECSYCHEQFETAHLLSHHKCFRTLPLKCDNCDERFGNMSILKEHDQLKHSQHPCPYCNKKLKSIGNLNRHIKSQHSHILSYYKCDQCENIYKYKCTLKKHVELFHSDSFTTSWNCDICNKCFKCEEYLKRHVSDVHLKQNKYVCSYCEQKFKRKENLKLHMNRKHNSCVTIASIPKINSANIPKTVNIVEVIQANTLKSLISSRVTSLFKLESSFCKQKEDVITSENYVPEIQPFSEVHLQEYHEENIKTELDATLTGEVETIIESDVDIKPEITIDEMDRSTLEKEESTEKALTDEGQFVSLDDTTQNDISTWKQEQAKKIEDIHEGRKTYFTCYLCKRDINLLVNLRKHLSDTHCLDKEEISKLIPVLKCKYCPREFELPSRLRRHEGSHTLPFKCDACDKRFCQVANLKVHKLTHSEPQYLCTYCGNKFRLKHHLKQHIEAQHRKCFSYYKCTQCKSKYKQKRNLISHVKIFHSSFRGISWKCDQCNARYTCKQNLLNHIVRIHLKLKK